MFYFIFSVIALKKASYWNLAKRTACLGGVCFVLWKMDAPSMYWSLADNVCRSLGTH